MPQSGIDGARSTWVIHQHHAGDGGTPENIERKKSAVARTLQTHSLELGFRSYQSGRKGHGCLPTDTNFVLLSSLDGTYIVSLIYAEYTRTRKTAPYVRQLKILRRISGRD